MLDRWPPTAVLAAAVLLAWAGAEAQCTLTARRQHCRLPFECALLHCAGALLPRARPPPSARLALAESPEGRRTAVVVLKSRPTPSQYPRKPGVPGKKPL